MFDVNCPHCDEPHFILKINEYANMQENKVYHWRCGKCKKIFTFRVKIFYRMYPMKANCMNGGNHEWKKLMDVHEKEFWWCPACGSRTNKKPRNLMFTTKGKNEVTD